MSGTNNAVPVAMVGGILWLAHRFYVNSSSGFGIGIGAGGGLFGVSLTSFLFGSRASGGDHGSSGEGGTKESGASKQKGPLDQGGGTQKDPPKDGESNDGKSDDGKSDDGKSDDGKSGKSDGKSGGTGSNGGVGGGSGGGVGSDQGQSTDGGVGDEGGDKGADEGGGKDDGIYDYDPYDGQYVTENLPPPDMSEAMLDAIQGTIENLVGFSVIDPGTDPEVAEKLPPELWTYDPEVQGLLRYWADVTLHFHYDLPWGVLDEKNPTHVPYIKLWSDILSNLAKLEWDTNKNSTPIIPVSTPSRGVRRRGVGDSTPNFTWFKTRDVYINPLAQVGRKQ